MISITRNLARQLRAVFRHAIGPSPQGTAPAVMVRADRRGLCIRAKAQDAAIEYRIDGDLPPEQIVLPGECLADCEGRKDDPVTLEHQGYGAISASWRDGGVPLLMQYQSPEGPGDEFPPTPENLAENPPRLLIALSHALETTDADSSRFATDHIELRGRSGAIAATDGRQLLVQRGFAFPWEGPILIPRTTAFGCRELPQASVVEIGRTEDWVMIRVGSWTVHLRIGKDRRFPKIDDHIPAASGAIFRVQFAPSDGEFLAKSLARLPGDDDFNRPITVDLNGQVAVRAQADDQSQATEVVLSHSTLSGEPVRFTTNRRFLARALRLGFQELVVYGAKMPVMCQDEDRRYVWAVLDPESALKPSQEAIRIASPAAASDADSKPPSVTRRRQIPVTETPSEKNGSAAAPEPRTKASSKSESAEGIDLLEQAEAVKAALRDAHTKVSELISSLKRQQKQFRLVQSTISSLQQLKAIGA